MRTDRRNPSSESGFALILAILSLMLLTFLGLTLATTTSTELQIATNYRWSQQALYNAQAGLEAAKLLLSDVARTGGNWGQLVPAPRTAAWSAPIRNQNLGGVTAPPGAVGGRDYERNDCATGDRSGVGYGVVLRANNTRWEDVSTFMGQNLSGAFTLWVRREVVPATDGTFTDDAAGAPIALVITSEGVAPYVGASSAFTRANQATRVIELTLALVTVDRKCRQPVGQEGAGPSGENFDTCSRLTPGAGGSLGRVFGTGGGTLAALPVTP
jgi:Tfp pilus assembly protein PilX